MNNLDVGEWISLRQSLIWLKTGRNPLGRNDEVAIGEWDNVAAPDYSDERKSLLLSLRRGRILSKGLLDIYAEGHEMFDASDHYPESGWNKFLEKHKKQDGTYECTVFDEYAIPGDLWKAAYIDWNRGVLWNNRGFRVQGRFCSVSLSKSQVLACGREEFQPNDRAFTTFKSGRPTLYDWPTFYVEIIVRADLDGLPAKQAELVRDMLEWCQRHWKKEPSESLVKEKIAPIYRHPRKAKKQFPA
jgi:hypothetical protein